MKEPINLSDDEESLYGTEEEKPKARYSQKDISIDRLPTYRGGDFAKFYKEWTNAISLHGERSPREKLFYLPLAFAPNVRSLVMESVYSLNGETPNYELFVKSLFKIHGAEMQVEKTVSERLREIIENKKKGMISLTQYIGFFDMNYEQSRKKITELEIIKLFLEGLDHKLAKKITRKLTGPDRQSLENVFRWVNRFTIDWEGKRHEGLVFEDEEKETRQINNQWEKNSNKFARSRINEERNTSIPFKQRGCNACGKSDHTHGECPALRKAIIDKLIYRNDKGRLCVVATGGEVRRPFGETWIAYARKATEGKGRVVNRVIYQMEEEKESVLEINNLTQYQKSPAMEVREQIEKKISEKIDEALVTVPAKMLLDHPGILA
ncbi:hypothetical protein HMI54_010432 [Coelomomyces lativittatus]|nr:hypothetical protein HMI54_010432 [Coelomomyces lativittatus]